MTKTSICLHPEGVRSNAEEPIRRSWCLCGVHFIPGRPHDRCNWVAGLRKAHHAGYLHRRALNHRPPSSMCGILLPVGTLEHCNRQSGRNGKTTNVLNNELEFDERLLAPLRICRWQPFIHLGQHGQLLQAHLQRIGPIERWRCEVHACMGHDASIARLYRRTSR